jgi:hypothetical protein
MSGFPPFCCRCGVGRTKEGEDQETNLLAHFRLPSLVLSLVVEATVHSVGYCVGVSPGIVALASQNA